MAKDFFRELIKDIPNTSLAIDGDAASEFQGYINTHCYLLNAALSGSLFGGMPNNKVLTLAGESATGKTFFALALVDSFLREHPEGGCIYFDTEQAITNDMLIKRGMDLKRIIKSEPMTVEEYRTRAVQILDKYMAQEPKARRPLIMVTDSLGGLTSEKEKKDITEGNNVRDMTRAQLLRGTFRVLRPKLAQAGVAMVVTNHTYQVVGAYVPTSKMGGGAGLQYTSDTIAFLSKKKDKDSEGTVQGNIIHVKMEKSRLSRENTMVDVKLSYTTGLSKYYGLLEMAVEAGIVEKVGNKFKFPNGDTQFGKKINAEPEKYFTQEFLQRLEDDYVSKNFRYMMGAESVVEGDDGDDEE